MVIFQYNLYIFGIHLWTMLYPKPCYKEPCYKEVEVYFTYAWIWKKVHLTTDGVFWKVPTAWQSTQIQIMFWCALLSQVSWMKYIYCIVEPQWIEPWWPIDPGQLEWTLLFVLRFYGPVNPMGSCRARSVYLTTCLLGRLSPLSG